MLKQLRLKDGRKYISFLECGAAIQIMTNEGNRFSINKKALVEWLNKEQPKTYNEIIAERQARYNKLGD